MKKGDQMINLPHFKTDEAILVVMRRDNSYDLSDGSTFVPEGTRFIGMWATEQPDDKTICAVSVEDNTWHFPLEGVALSPLDEYLEPGREQARIAAESLALAQEQERHQHPADAQRLYARALLELEASGKSSADLTEEIRQKRVFLLKEVGNIPEALTECERLARTYETMTLRFGYGNVDRNYAELAAWAWKMTGDMLMHTTDDQQSDITTQKLSMVADRLLSLVTYLARRYDSKAHMLLTISEIKHVLGDIDESIVLFKQADTVYVQKHLGSTARSGDGLSLQRTRLSETLGLSLQKNRTSSRAKRQKEKKRKP